MSVQLLGLEMTSTLMVWTGAWAHSGDGEYYGGHMFGSPWHSGWFGGIFMLLLFGLIVATLILVARWLLGNRNDRGSQGRRDDPLDILKERFARGEIDKDAYEEARRMLGD